MDLPFWVKLSEYGIVGIVIGVLFFILWQIVCWAKSFITKQAEQYFTAVTAITEQHTKERIAWLTTLNSLNQSIELHNQGSIEARRATEEAHRYQKEEHEKLAEHMSTVCQSLKQTEQALGRINGYVK